MNKRAPMKAKQAVNEENNSVADVHASLKKCNPLHKKGALNLKSGNVFLSNNNIQPSVNIENINQSNSDDTNGCRQKENSRGKCKDKSASQAHTKKFGEKSRIISKRRIGNAGVGCSSSISEKNISNRRKSINKPNELKLYGRNVMGDDGIKRIHERGNINEIKECGNMEHRESPRGTVGKGIGTTATTASSSSDYPLPITKRNYTLAQQGKNSNFNRNEPRNDASTFQLIAGKNGLKSEGIQIKGRGVDINPSYEKGVYSAMNRNVGKGKRRSHLCAIEEYPLTSKNIYDSIYIPQININNLLNIEDNTTDNTNVKRKDNNNNNNNNVLNNLNAFSNVRVAVRIRPIDEPKESIVTIFNKKYVLIEKENEKESYLLSQKKKQSTYVFDVVFDVNATQEEVFEETAKPLIPHVFEGINCTVFAYGATGSGKTYTMLDDKNQNGIVQLSLLELFTMIKKRNCKNIKVVVSFLEVYNETIRDLLEREKKKALEVQEDVAEVKVNNLCEREVHSYEEAMALITEGVKNRKMSPTRANKVSSRSHAILQIYVLNEVLDERMNLITYKAKLCFVDLAGSERASATSNKGERFKEGSFINQSLLALANCINSLASNKSVSKVRVKYRDSKLTHLLKNSLEGNCLVVMIANINPSRKSFQESNNTLKYAFRARNIKLCATVHTNENKETELEKLLKKTETLQKEYNELSTKYNDLKNAFSDFSYLFQIYRNALVCYQEKEKSSDNLYVLELKQKICMHEQFIKVKLDEVKKKVMKVDCEETQHFLAILDATPNTNLNISLNNSCSIFNEIENKVPVYNIFVPSPNNSNPKQSYPGNFTLPFSIQNQQPVNQEKIRIPISNHNDTLADRFPSGAVIESTDVSNNEASTAHSNILPPIAVTTTTTTNNNNNAANNTNIINTHKNITTPFALQPRRVSNEKTNEDKCKNNIEISVLNNDKAKAVTEGNEDVLCHQNLPLYVKRSLTANLDEANKNNRALVEDKTDEETTHKMAEFQKMKKGKSWQAGMLLQGKKERGKKEHTRVGRYTCFLNRKGSINENGIKHELVLKKGNSTESIIMTDDNIEKMSTEIYDVNVPTVQEKAVKLETKEINDTSKITAEGVNENVCNDVKYENIQSKKISDLGIVNTTNSETVECKERAKNLTNLKNSEVAIKPGNSDVCNKSALDTGHTEEVVSANEIKKKSSSSSSSLSSASFVTSKSRDTNENVVNKFYNKQLLKHSESMNENKRKKILNEENTKKEHVETIMKPKKKRMKS